MCEKYRHWAFTLNNYTDDDLDKLQSLPSGAVYLVYGKEIGESGTPHLQGFISYKSARNVSGIRDFFNGSAHVEVARNPAAAAQYCKKEGNFIEFGSPSGRSISQGKRSDLSGLVSAISAGETDRKKLRTEFPDVCAKYPNFVSSVILDHLPRPNVQCHPLCPWQSRLVEKLRTPPDDREILFMIDKHGNAGKSWFVQYYIEHVGKALQINPGKKADMIYAFISSLKSDTRVVFVDAPRSKQGDFIQYDFLEELKNGCVFNTKYESRMVYFTVPHVVVMMNENPKEGQLSEDRVVECKIKREEIN